MGLFYYLLELAQKQKVKKLHKRAKRTKGLMFRAPPKGSAEPIQSSRLFELQSIPIKTVDHQIHSLYYTMRYRKGTETILFPYTLLLLAFEFHSDSRIMK